MRLLCAQESPDHIHRSMALGPRSISIEDCPGADPFKTPGAQWVVITAVVADGPPTQPSGSRVRY
jgi:hypothetical protein